MTEIITEEHQVQSNYNQILHPPRTTRQS